MVTAPCAAGCEWHKLCSWTVPGVAVAGGLHGAPAGAIASLHECHQTQLFTAASCAQCGPVKLAARDWALPLLQVDKQQYAGDSCTDF